MEGKGTSSVLRAFQHRCPRLFLGCESDRIHPVGLFFCPISLLDQYHRVSSLAGSESGDPGYLFSPSAGEEIQSRARP
jgi:hypothetical protein